MKIEFIHRGAATRLILIFAGWSTDTRFYRECVFNGWDTAIISDYQDMTMPEIPNQYKTVYLFAYSLGVWAASFAGINADLRIAVFGTPIPISDDYGIPEAIFSGTANGLNEKNLSKFHLRMAGDKDTFIRMQEKLPTSPDITSLKRELLAIADYSRRFTTTAYHWNRAYIAYNDRIIPAINQHRYWESLDFTESICIDSPHYADMVSIIRECLPNHDSISKGFEKALPSYSKNAVIQTEVCERIGNIIKDTFAKNGGNVNSILEIGPGAGTLTEVWSKYLSPVNCSYIDLYQMPVFGVSTNERYFVEDAEEWLYKTDEKFDVIVSASAIQWFVNPIRFIKDTFSHLNPGGIAILSTYVFGNLIELNPLRPSPIIYHSEKEYLSIESAVMERWTRTIEFDTARELLMHLKNTGVKPSGNINRLSYEKPLIMASLPRRLTYEPLIIKITK